MIRANEKNVEISVVWMVGGGRSCCRCGCFCVVQAEMLRKVLQSRIFSAIMSGIGG